MLMLSFVSLKEQEAIMSPVKALPKTSPLPSKVSVADYARPANVVPMDRKASPEITHAWSIGVTDAGRLVQPERRQETCPPEVYIG